MGVTCNSNLFLYWATTLGLQCTNKDCKRYTTFTISRDAEIGSTKFKTQEVNKVCQKGSLDLWEEPVTGSSTGPLLSGFSVQTRTANATLPSPYQKMLR